MVLWKRPKQIAYCRDATSRRSRGSCAVQRQAARGSWGKVSARAIRAGRLRSLPVSRAGRGTGARQPRDRTALQPDDRRRLARRHRRAPREQVKRDLERPELHADTKTSAKVCDRSRMSSRRSLQARSRTNRRRDPSLVNGTVQSTFACLANRRVRRPSPIAGIKRTKALQPRQS